MLQIDFINVGYGDSILMQFTGENGHPFRVLTDCGDCFTERNSPESCRISSADFLVKNGIDSLDLLILSHLHLDHTGGLRDIAGRIRVKELLSNYLPPEEYRGHKVRISPDLSPGSANLLRSINILSEALPILSAEGCRIREIRKPERIAVPGCDAGLSISLSDPSVYDLQKRIFDKAQEGRADDAALHRLDLFINNTSLRVHTCIGSRSVMLPGDIYAAEWEKFEIPHCDILKVPHHGHIDGLNEDILRRTGAEYVVISVSDDREDNCPAPDISSLIRTKKAHLYFTDAVKESGRDPEYHESVRFYIRDTQIIPAADL